MFSWLNKQGVRSDRGFEVQRTGRFSAEYREGGKVAEFYVEAGGVQTPSIIVDPGAFARWDDGTPISQDERTRIFENVRDAMAFQGLKMIVEAGE